MWYKIYYVQKDREIDPVLYAFTDDKHLLKRFKDERNMKLFRILEGEKKEELDYQKHYNYQLELKEIPMRTFSRTDWEMYQIRMVGTRGEEHELSKLMEDFIITFQSVFRVNPELFNDEIKEALDDLLYTGLYYWSTVQNDIPFNIDASKDEYLKEFRKTFKYDEFELFCARFGATLKTPD